MIEKKGKGNRVEDLCTIDLLEVDYNFNNKILAKMIIECIEYNKLIPEEQYGSRKDHKAIDQVNNKRLLYDLAHLQRRPMILYSMDAKSYNDRIILS